MLPLPAPVGVAALLPPQPKRSSVDPARTSACNGPLIMEGLAGTAPLLGPQNADLLIVYLCRMAMAACARKVGVCVEQVMARRHSLLVTEKPARPSRGPRCQQQPACLSAPSAVP